MSNFQFHLPPANRDNVHRLRPCQSVHFIFDNVECYYDPQANWLFHDAECIFAMPDTFNQRHLATAHFNFKYRRDIKASCKAFAKAVDALPKWDYREVKEIAQQGSLALNR